ncbi:MAG: hypothetical protein ABIN18_10065 [Pseudomonadota bacterium]
MRTDENVMRSLLQGRDVSGATTSCPVPESILMMNSIITGLKRWELMVEDYDDFALFANG